VRGAVASQPATGAPGAAPPRAVAGPLVSPRARRLLVDAGFSLEDAEAIAGSGPGGRIVDRDVAAWIETHASSPAPAPADGLSVSSRIPLRGRRGTIAQRMVSSLQTAAQLVERLPAEVYGERSDRMVGLLLERGHVCRTLPFTRESGTPVSVAMSARGSRP